MSEPGRSAATDKLILAIDIGGTKLAAGLMTPQGELLDRDRLAVDHDLSGDGLFASLVALARNQLDRAATHHRRRVTAIGVASAGPITLNADSVSPVNIAAWRNFPLRPRLQAELGLPTFGDLDAKSLALAEGWLGAAVGRQNFMAVTVSTGVGGGVVLNGQLLDGATGNAGHVGHITVVPNGRRCGCGARGCLEAEASGLAIEAITGRPPTEPSYEIMQRTGRLVGLGVASVCNMLDLDLVVIGGSVALGFGATFFNAAQESLDEHARLTYSRTARVVSARLGDRGPLIGAGALAVRGMHRARTASAAADGLASIHGSTDTEVAGS